MQKNSLFRRLLITLTLTGAAICLIHQQSEGYLLSSLSSAGEIQGIGSAGNHGNRSVSAGYLQGTATGM